MSFEYHCEPEADVVPPPLYDPPMEASAPPSVPHVPHDPALFARGKPQVWEAGDRGSLPLPSIEDARAVCFLLCQILWCGVV
jgi:hypothetical protein